MQFAWGYVPPLMMEAAIRNRVFDSLDAAPLTLDELASATGASTRGLTALCNGLVSIGLLAKEGDRYALTPESSAFLVSTKPAYQGGFIRHISTQLIRPWLQLTDIVTSGRPAQAVNTEDTGTKFFSEFVNDIFPMSYPATQALAGALGLPAATGPVRVLDIGAGSGVWGIGLAHSSPHVTVTAVDWAGMIPTTRGTVARHGLTERFTFVEGDLDSADFGSGQNVCTIGHIFHSEGVERSRMLIKRVFDALAPGGTIAVAEFLVNPDRTGPPVGTFFALNMLVNTEVGDTWSFEEIAGWLTEAGFTNTRQIEAPGPSPLILATKP